MHGSLLLRNAAAATQPLVISATTRRSITSAVSATTAGATTRRRRHRHRRRQFVGLLASFGISNTGRGGCCDGGGSILFSKALATSSAPPSLPWGRSRRRAGPSFGGDCGGASRLSSARSSATRSSATSGGGRTMFSTSSFRRSPIATADMTLSPFLRQVRKVVVVGGTHGNEYTGVWCIRAIEAQRQRWRASDEEGANGDESANGGGGGGDYYSVFEKFPSLDIDTLLANPVAHMQNKRFVDSDLNREFSAEKLRRVEGVNVNVKGDGGEKECDLRTEFCAVDAETMRANRSLPHEAMRAREIESLLGPKLSPDDDRKLNDNPKTDVVVDLHTTTCNMGICLIVPEGDPLMSAAAAFVAHKCRMEYGYDDEVACSVRVLMHPMPHRSDRPNLGSCGRHGFTVEVGPVPQGVLRHDVVEKTQAALDALLEFLHRNNLEVKGGTVKDSSSSVLDELRRIYPGNIVPCYRSAPSVRPGELSGKISWPNVPSNPNFPAVMVHKSLQDEDFRRLSVGDPLFVEPDGTVIRYNGSHGDDVRVIFVNEGGYYYESSGTGIGVAVESKFNWETGRFIVDVDDDDDGGDEAGGENENDSEGGM